ncbi:MAG: hypothetical protein AABW50_05500 [Nanoarchaeota archaeon]
MTTLTKNILLTGIAGLTFLVNGCKTPDENIPRPEIKQKPLIHYAIYKHLEYPFQIGSLPSPANKDNKYEI